MDPTTLSEGTSTDSSLASIGALGLAIAGALVVYAAIRVARHRGRNAWLWALLTLFSFGAAVVLLLLLGHAGDKRDGLRKILVSVGKVAILPLVLIGAVLARGGDTIARMAEGAAHLPLDAARFADSLNSVTATVPPSSAIMEAASRTPGATSGMSTYDEIVEIIALADDVGAIDIIDWYRDLKELYDATAKSDERELEPPRLSTNPMPEDHTAIDVVNLPVSAGQVALGLRNGLDVIGAVPPEGSDALRVGALQDRLWIDIFRTAALTGPAESEPAIHISSDGGNLIVVDSRVYKQGTRICLIPQRVRIVLDRSNLPSAGALALLFKATTRHEKRLSHCWGFMRKEDNSVRARMYDPSGRVYISVDRDLKQPPDYIYRVPDWPQIAKITSGW